MWRSSVSLNNLSAVSQACGVRIPACGPGLVCWPGDSRTTFYSNGTVTCPASRECAGIPGGLLDFDIQTLAAPYKPRWSSNAEFFPTPISYLDAVDGTPRTVPAGALVMSGGSGSYVNNDVWLSTDGGVLWALIAGYASRATDPGGLSRAWYPQSETSFVPSGGEAVGIVDERHHFIYRIGGNGGSMSTTEVNDVWRTSDAVNWVKMSATGLVPLRSATGVVDDEGTIYIAGGIRNSNTQSTLFVSKDNGTSFYQPTPQPPPFLAYNGRSGGFLLHHKSPSLGREVLTFGSGWNISHLHNDIWVSSDDSVSWELITAAAPFKPRDAAGAEITAGGLIVLAGGETTSGPANDVYVSADGGYTWGVCSEEAYWPDLRETSTAMDKRGYFYVLNGRASADGGTRTFNDVYKSSFSFLDTANVSTACNIDIPACGVGLTCWPTAPDTVVTSTGVTCDKLRACETSRRRSSSSSSPSFQSSSYSSSYSSSSPFVSLSSTSVDRRSSSSSFTARPPTPADPCADDPEWSPDCWNYPSTSSTGSEEVNDLSSGAISGIVVMIVVVIGGALLLLFYRRWKGKQQRPALTESWRETAAVELLSSSY